jgi:hypothetical protein
MCYSAACGSHMLFSAKLALSQLTGLTLQKSNQKLNIILFKSFDIFGFTELDSD